MLNVILTSKRPTEPGQYMMATAEMEVAAIVAVYEVQDSDKLKIAGVHLVINSGVQLISDVPEIFLFSEKIELMPFGKKKNKPATKQQNA